MASIHVFVILGFILIPLFPPKSRPPPQSLGLDTSLPQKECHQNAPSLDPKIGFNGKRKILLGTGINLCDVVKEIQDTAGVTPLVVVPGNQLDEVCVQGDTGLGIEDGRVGVTDHIGGDDLILGVCQYACLR